MSPLEVSLAVATLLGGVAALWYVIDQWLVRRAAGRAASTEREFFVAATVANVAGVDQSFQIRTSVPGTARVAELIRNTKVQLAITRSLALTGKPPAQFQLTDISEPTLFAWNLTELSPELPVAEIPDRRILIAVFDPAPGWPPIRAAAHTKAAIVGKPEIRGF